MIKIGHTSPMKTKSKTKKSLAHLLKSYVTNFSIDLDDEWDKCDIDKNDVLSKNEAKKFLDSISQHVD